MPALDIFKGDAFSVQELTDAINIIPNNYGRIRELGIFREKGVKTTSVMVEINNGVLTILPPTQRGGSATVGKTGKRSMVSFVIPNFTHFDDILADDIQDVRAFGSESELETIQKVVLDKLETARSKHDITLEYMRAGALQGVVKNDQGEVLLDLFETFGVTQRTQDFVFGTTATKVDKFIRDVKRYIETNLKGEIMSGIKCLCSSKFFESLVAHASVKDAYNAYQGLTPYREDLRKQFVFQGVSFEEYLGSASNNTGTVLPFIPDGEAIFFPVGTHNAFVTYFAPADFNETINTIGKPLYAKQKVKDFDRGVEILTESNPLPICTRPNLLVKGFSSN
jgi:hypothetical protein